MTKLTHLDERGQARMVAVDEKAETRREAEARGRVTMRPTTLALIRRGDHHKGDVLAAARLAAIMATKRTAELIPLCHPLRLTSVDVAFDETDGDPAAITIRVIVKALDRTGVEMEALHGVTVAALTLYDMCKAVDRDMTITDVALWRKSGGRSGDWVRDAPETP